jgi:hypothetical protein
LSYLHYIENEHELIEMDIVGFKSKRAQNVNDYKVKLRKDVMDFAFINDFLVLVGSNVIFCLIVCFKSVYFSI